MTYITFILFWGFCGIFNLKYMQKSDMLNYADHHVSKDVNEMNNIGYAIFAILGVTSFLISLPIIKYDVLKFFSLTFKSKNIKIWGDVIHLINKNPYTVIGIEADLYVIESWPSLSKQQHIKKVDKNQLCRYYTY